MLLRRSFWLCLTAAGALLGPLLTGPLLAGPAGAAAVPTIWPLGDSITFGLSGGTSANGTTVEDQTPGGYRGVLDSLLGKDGVAHQFVGTSTGNPTPVLTREGQAGHDGHPGYRIDQDSADLDGLAVSTSDDGGRWMTRPSDPIRPGVVIVLLGANDILQGYDPSTTFPTPSGRADYSDRSQVASFVADMISRLKALVDKIELLQPGTRILLSDTPPMGTAGPDAVTGPYADAVQALAGQERQAGVPVAGVDVWSQFVESTPQGTVIVPGMIGQDGIHPTAAGYQAIANAFRGPLESLLAG